MKDKKSRVDFNGASAKRSPLQKRHYSYKEVAQKLNMYEKLAKTKTQKKDMRDLRDEHFKEKMRKDSKDGVRNEYFRQAYVKGFHTDDQKKTVQEMQKMEESKAAKNVLAKANGLYRHYGLSSRFVEAKLNQGKEKAKEKAKEKGRAKDHANKKSRDKDLDKG